MTQIISCIDGSANSKSVCDAGAWASRILRAPLVLLHVLERSPTPAKDDLSGSIGLGSREHLLDELTAVDEQRSKLALEHGKHMLEAAAQQAKLDGVDNIVKQQRHGHLLETLQDLEPNTRLIVMGRQGEDHKPNANTLGTHLESVVRAMHNPILVTVGEFNPPSRIMIAYDGSATSNKAIERVAGSALLKGLECHLVLVGTNKPEREQSLQQAASLLGQHGFEVQAHLLEGEVQTALSQFKLQNKIDLMVMGAYGHSRIRQFFVGSNTSKMIGSSKIPLLLLR